MSQGHHNSWLLEHSYNYSLVYPCYKNSGTNLEKWVNYHCCKAQNLDFLNLLKCSLASCHHSYDDDSDASFNTYLSACNSMYSIYDNAYDTPPINNSPATQVWDDPDAMPRNINPVHHHQQVQLPKMNLTRYHEKMQN